MNARRFDKLVSTPGAFSSRRQVFKVLGGGAVLGASGLAIRGGGAAAKAAEQQRAASTGGTPEDAGRSEASRRRHQRRTTCRRGKKVASLVVPANGTTVNTPDLRNGQRYRLRATGFWLTNEQFGNDAFAAFSFADPLTPVLTLEGVRVGLAVDGGSPNLWGDYNPAHGYQIEVTGHGRTMSLGYIDPIRGDNSGAVKVEITCA